VREIPQIATAGHTRSPSLPTSRLCRSGGLLFFFPRGYDVGSLGEDRGERALTVSVGEWKSPGCADDGGGRWRGIFYAREGLSERFRVGAIARRDCALITASTTRAAGALASAADNVAPCEAARIYYAEP